MPTKAMPTTALNAIPNVELLTTMVARFSIQDPSPPPLILDELKVRAR